MSDFDNTNRGVLFDNERKQSDRHPDMTGTINIAGVDHWFSGWWKTGNKGEFLSLSIGDPKEQQQQQQRQPPQRSAPPPRGNRPSGQVQQRQPGRGRAPASGFNDMDDDILYRT